MLDVVLMGVAGLHLLVLPRRWAVMPLILAAAYTTRLPVLEVGPASLSALRILVIVGAIRVFLRGERRVGRANAIDLLVFGWAALLIGTSVFHTSDAWTFRIGVVLGELGVYVLCRVLIQDAEDIRRLFKFLCIGMVPLAILMILEKATAHNFFYSSGEVLIRDGHVRACGPLGHPILAGAVGATCVPMALCLWRTHRASALIGLLAGLGIVFASTSSGPVMMVLFTCIALALWPLRDSMRLIRWGTLAGIVGLDLVMNDPVYFLMARIDLTGSSTGWFRSELIRSSLAHLSEWWAVGTDYTRHWMPSGIPANAHHTDITNHFLLMGVMGGLPLLVLFVLILTAAFRAIGSALRENKTRSRERSFLIWTLGAMLFGQVMNFWSISLFDQSASFFYLVLATIGAVQPIAVAAKDGLSRHQERRRAKDWKRRAAVLAPRAGWVGGSKG